MSRRKSKGRRERERAKSLYDAFRAEFLETFGELLDHVFVLYMASIEGGVTPQEFRQLVDRHASSPSWTALGDELNALIESRSG